MDLRDKVCLITGAAEGIGRAIAEGFIGRGARVVATDRVPVEGLEGAAALRAYDVTDPTAGPEVVADIVQKFGRLDVFIANAGAMPRQEWNAIGVEDWEKILRVNLDGAWFGAQAAAKVMTEQGQGKIIFVSSVEVRLGVAVHCHYDAAKAGLIGLTRSLARALGPSGVRVNCLMPGAVKTASEINDFPDKRKKDEELSQRQCLPARVLPADIEPVAAFLSAQESDAITGQVLCVDHGLIHY